MLDIKLIREHPEIVKNDLKKRREEEKIQWVDELLKYDKEWRQNINKINQLRQKRNEVTQKIAELKKKNKDTSDLLKEIKNIPDQIKKLEQDAEKYKEKVTKILMQLPNILDPSVPYGVDDHDNVEIRRWGKPLKFDFEPKNHLEIAENLGMIDSKRAAKVAGHGFFYIKDDLALLEQSLIRFTIDFMIKRGYVFVIPPYMLHKKPYLGVTDLEFFGDQLYKIEGEDLYLIATAEHPLASMFMDEVIDKKDLPIKLVGLSPCFRKEVGAHGKYTKGLFRMHQFHKIEQFIFCLPKDSPKLHEELQKNSEDLYKALGLRYRVVNVCTGDIGIIASKKYDTEILMADGQYREVGSNSNCTDYQARRLNIKFREKPGQPPAGFVHTLNNTAIATSRTLIGILEQYQQKDGSVKIPDVLVPYMNGKKFLVKK